MPHEPDKPDFTGATAGSSTASSAKQTIRTYKVADGDSLAKVAQKFYGNADHWRVIYEANRDQISNPDLIQPGQVLKIPLTAGVNG